MDVTYLREDELDYELQIRNCEKSGPSYSKRAYLRSLLQLEREHVSFQSPLAYPEPLAEHRTCSIKLHEILGMFFNITPLSFHECEQFNKEVSSRLIHLQLRILRLPAHLQHDLIKLLSVVNDAQLRHQRPVEDSSAPNLITLENSDTEPRPSASVPAETCRLVNNATDPGCQDFINRMNALQFTVSAPNTPQTKPLPQANSSTFDQPNVHFPTPVQIRHPSSTMLPSLDSKIQVGRWNITFDGSSGVNDFLERIQEAAFARNVSHDQLFRQATDLFTGNALIWFRMIRPNLSSWSELTSRLRATFLPANYDLALHQEIRSRTQGPSEKSEIFIAKMENLFARLTNIPDEQTRVATILGNLQPTYQRLSAMQPITTLEELIRVCKRIEDTEYKVATFKNPPFSNPSLLEPDLAYSRPPRTSQYLTTPVAAVSSPVAATAHRFSNPGRACWNCGSKEHLYPACDKPRNIFCYSCGRKNTHKRDCPKCNPKNVCSVSEPSVAETSDIHEPTEMNGLNGSI